MRKTGNDIPLDYRRPGRARSPFGGLVHSIKLGMSIHVVTVWITGLAIAQVPTLVFPHVVDGGGFRLEVILTNATAQEDTGTIFFKASDGSANVLTVEGSQLDSLAYAIPPGGVFRKTTDGLGDLKGGYATVVSDNLDSKVRGMVVLNLNGVDLAVPSTTLSSEFHVFTERNSDSR